MRAVTAAAYYRQLVQLGRDEFLAASAAAAFVRFRSIEDELMPSAIEPVRCPCVCTSKAAAATPSATQAQYGTSTS